MATLRPYEDMTDEELQEQIAALTKQGLRPTSSVHSGLVRESDYVSPGGRRGLTVQQNPNDALANAIRVEKKDIEADSTSRGQYWGAMDRAEQGYNKSMAQASALGSQDRLQRDLQEIEGKLSGYGGVPRGTRSYLSKWAGSEKNLETPTQDEGYKDLLRQKYAIQNALMGKGVDIKEAVPDKKTAGQLIPGPDGSLLQVDESGKVTRVLDREKPVKPTKKAVSYIEQQKIKQAIEIIGDPTNSDEDRATAQAYLDKMEKKYAGSEEETVTGDEENGEEEGAATAMTTKKKIARIGKDKKTGRKVVQYEDGTMAYGD